MFPVKLPGLHKSPETLLNNTVDKDFQSILRPLNLPQIICCTPKYRVRDNFITPNGIFENILTFCGVIVFLVISISCTIVASYSNNLLPDDTFLYCSSLSNKVISAIGSIINAFVSFTLSCHNTQLVLRLQTSHRLMGYTKRDYRQLTFYHWIKVVLLYLICVILCIYFHIYLCSSDIYEVFYELILICFDMNIVYAILIIELITKSMSHWHKEIRLKTVCPRENKLFDLYINIMLSYEMFKKTFQHLILFYVISTFLQALINVQILIESAKIDHERDVSSITLIKLFTWLLKNLILQVTLGVESESFYIQVHNVETTCITALATDCSERRRFYKNIIRLNQVSFNKMNACGFFTVDAGSTIRLIGSIATYTIVLLQYAYL